MNAAIHCFLCSSKSIIRGFVWFNSMLQMLQFGAYGVTGPIIGEPWRRHVRI